MASSRMNTGRVTVEQVLELARRPQGVTYAVSGSPLQANAAAHDLVFRAKTRGLLVRILPGLGYAEYAASLLGLDHTSNLGLIDAGELAALHVPPQAGTVPLLVSRVQDKALLEKALVCLSSIYPPDHKVMLINADPSVEVHMLDSTLAGIMSLFTTMREGLLYIPSMEPGSSFEDFQEVIARLRAPDGCPWDREQTHLSLRRHLLEETYEALEALDNEDPAKMSEEFGDLLLQIVLHAQIASEAGEFNMIDVVRSIHHKIVRRHPHVFGELQVEGVAGCSAQLGKIESRRAGSQRRRNKRPSGWRAACFARPYPGPGNPGARRQGGFRLAAN